jgi:hypothetical protein
MTSALLYVWATRQGISELPSKVVTKNCWFLFRGNPPVTRRAQSLLFIEESPDLSVLLKNS